MTSWNSAGWKTSPWAINVMVTNNGMATRWSTQREINIDGLIEWFAEGFTPDLLWYYLFQFDEDWGIAGNAVEAAEIVIPPWVVLTSVEDILLSFERLAGLSAHSYYRFFWGDPWTEQLPSTAGRWIHVSDLPYLWV